MTKVTSINEIQSRGITPRTTKRKQLIGTVVSTKNAKTITVTIDTYKKHPIYGKRLKVTKKLHAHDEKEIAHVGDIVKIVETRPLSKTKKFRLAEIIKKVVVLQKEDN